MTTFTRMTLAQLSVERVKFQAKIDGPENDGRITSGSSAALDYWMDSIDDIDAEVAQRGRIFAMCKRAGADTILAALTKRGVL